MKDDSYDLTNRKATLPIIKGIEAYTKYNNKENNNKINALFFQKNDNLYEEIRLLIIESGSLEYSNFLVGEYYQKAYDSLCNCFPNSHKKINTLFQYLRLRRDNGNLKQGNKNLKRIYLYFMNKNKRIVSTVI